MYLFYDNLDRKTSQNSNLVVIGTPGVGRKLFNSVVSEQAGADEPHHAIVNTANPCTKGIMVAGAASVDGKMRNILLPNCDCDFIIIDPKGQPKNVVTDDDDY